MHMHWMRPLGLAVVTAWALFWTFFAVAESTSDHNAVPGAIAACVIAGSGILAWHRTAIGGILVLAEGLVLTLAYPTGLLNAQSATQMAFVTVALALPPMIGGALLLNDRRASATHAAHR